MQVLRETEKVGIKLDTTQLETVATRIRADVAQLEREIWELADEEFMIGSPAAARRTSSSTSSSCSRKRRGKTGYSTDARVLQAIRDEHEIIPKIERYRELSKLAQTYLTRSRTGSATTAACTRRSSRRRAATGRLSSINPNLQNIPIRTETGREIRACFVPEPGNLLLSVDYGQVELRVLAHIANEQVLRDIFARGEDVHTETASAVFDLPAEQLDVGMRSKAKMVNYGIVYGLSAYGLADRLKIPQDEAQEFIDRYLERFPAVAQFMKDAVEQAEQHGYVSTLFGRRRQIPELRARNWQMRKLGERLAVNTVIQGTAADIIKVAMVRASDALAAAGLSTRVILQIHDELLFEGPPRRDGPGDGDRHARDGRRGRDGPAADGRRRRRRELAAPNEPRDRARRRARHRRRRRAPGPANSKLGHTVGGLPATMIALGVSFTALVILVALSGQLGGIRRRPNAPLYAVIGGGLVGALYVGSIVWTVRALGVTGLSAATLAGQFAAALTIDHFGWLGVDRSPITLSKLAGIALLAAGTYLIVRRLSSRAQTEEGRHMKLENEFTVPASIDEAWAFLLDVPRVAPCLPGATVEPGDEEGAYKGAMKVKIGPITASYKGTVKIQEADEANHKVAMRAQAKDARGQGTAAATITSTMEETAEGTKVNVVTDMRVTGPRPSSAAA